MQPNTSTPVRLSPEEQAIIRVRGANTRVAAMEFGGRHLVTSGRFIRSAVVRDEAFVQGEIVVDPEAFIAALRAWNVKPDLFSFPQKIGEPAPRYAYHTEWDDFAVIKITTYEDWLKNKIKKDARENLRRAKREGVVVRAAQYDDSFVQGIKGIYDETPIRQGKKFWHYGKSFEQLKELHGTYQERAEYIGAFLDDEMIGFLKMVYVDNFAKTMHVISKERHFQKRSTNALIAKAVEICTEKRLEHFIYGEFTFPGKKTSTLSEFKRRNGFEPVRYPRYFIPLTLKGKLALRLGIHHGMRRLVPAPLTEALVKARSAWHLRHTKKM